MAVRSITCPGCGEAVSYGRLSCPACGELLATVAGGGRQASAWIADRTSVPPEPEPEAEPIAPPVFEEFTVPAPQHADNGPWAATTPVEHPLAAFAAGPPIEPSAAFTPGASFASAAATATATWSDYPTLAPPRAMPTVRVSATLPERLVAVGGGLATLAFFLPWASAVIGAPPIPDPWDSFGIVGAWHMLALLLTVGTVGLSQYGERLNAWVRVGVVPLATAGILLGIDWYYLLTPIGGWIGAYVLAVGALVMGAGAVVGIRAAANGSRNARSSSTV